MEAQERGSVSGRGGTDQPRSGAAAVCTRRRRGVQQGVGWGPVPRAVEKRQLLLDENGFGDHGSGPASRATVASRWRNRTAGSRLGPIVTSWRNPKNANEFGIRHAHGRVGGTCRIFRSTILARTETNPFMQVDAQVTPVLALPSNISPVLSRQ
jgi:hypothetical protein